jgi:hypothetical protein
MEIYASCAHRAIGRSPADSLRMCYSSNECLRPGLGFRVCTDSEAIYLDAHDTVMACA